MVHDQPIDRRCPAQTLRHADATGRGVRDPRRHRPVEGALGHRQRVVQRAQSLADGVDGGRGVGDPARRDRGLAGEGRRHEPFVRVVAAHRQHLGHGRERGRPAHPLGFVLERGLGVVRPELHEPAVVGAEGQSAEGVLPRRRERRPARERADDLGDGHVVHGDRHPPILAGPPPRETPTVRRDCTPGARSRRAGGVSRLRSVRAVAAAGA